MQLVTVTKSSHLNKYGLGKVLKSFMDSISTLEKVKFTIAYSVINNIIINFRKEPEFNVNGEKIQLNGTILLTLADNLASHFLGGYKSLSSAL